jgi:hypothetical protein
VAEKLRDITVVDVDYATNLKKKMEGRSGRRERDDGWLRELFERESPFKSKLLRRRKDCVSLLKRQFPLRKICADS